MATCGCGWRCDDAEAERLGKYGCPNCNGEAQLVIKKNRAAVSLGRKGGKVTSETKAIASRMNGRKGGRPKKPLAETPDKEKP